MSKALTVRSYLHPYQVVFTDSYLKELRQQAREQKCYFIVDARIAKLYAAPLRPFLHPQRTYVLKAVEGNKNLATAGHFIQFLLKAGFKRNDRIIALGGGIVQDICGFTSSTLFRGVDWIFYPTTLLAQADSCIGSKNCINVGGFKNQLGTFYPPKKVVLDTAFLRSLAREDICSGLGEIIKFFTLDSRFSLELIAKNYDRTFEDDRLMRQMIRRSLAIKKRIIEIDEFDRGIRNMFNYGHTFGHAIESLTKYRIRHGQAITLGMGLANYVSLRLGYLKQRDHDAMRAVIAKNSPAFRMSARQQQEYVRHLSKDKKNIGNRLTCILLKAPGQAFKATLPFDRRLRSIIHDYFA